MEQGSAEWFAARCGKVTASRIADLMARTKSGWGASRANYMAELLVERLTGQPVPSYSNAAMQWGTETEQKARMAYEFMRDCGVEQVGFVEHPYIEDAGASPDGLVGDPALGRQGLVEIKCPNTATHIDTLLNGKVPEKYVLQMQWQMACTAREWCDFVSFDPRMPAAMQMFVQRIERDDDLIKILEKDVRTFLAELSLKVAVLRTTYDLKQTLVEAAE